MSAVRHPPADILLDPSDWYVANWRNLPPLPRPDPPPFDLAAWCKRLAGLKPGRAGFDWTAEVGPCPGPEEGRFWLAAFERGSVPGKNFKEVAADLSKQGPLPRLSRTKCTALLRDPAVCHTPAVVAALASQLDVAALVAAVLDVAPCVFRRPLGWTQRRADAHETEEVILAGFRRFVRPYLTPAELETARQTVRGHLAEHQKGVPDAILADHVCALMASLGMSDEVESAISSWISDYHDRPERHFAVFGLAAPTKVLPAFKRLRLRVCRPGHVRGLLAHLEAKAVPYLRDAILASANRPEAERVTPAFGLVHRPETARAMLALTQRSRAPAPAQRWLDEHPELAIPGLLPLVNDEQLGEPALNYLRHLVRTGHQDLIGRHVGRLPAEDAARVRRALETTAALHAVEEYGVPVWFPPAEGRKPRLPAWLDPATLPPLRIEGNRLPAEQVTTVLVLLRDAPLESPPPLFAQLKKHTEPRLLDAFVWAVFDRWHSASADPKDKWALIALGHLGGDGVCLPLAALVGTWPGKSQHLRATLGLRCLEAIGSPLALLCIWRLAQTSQYLALQSESEYTFNRLAERRKLSAAELEDRVVPDLGLDGDGSRRLPYSGQAYRLAVGPDRQARLIDERRQFLSEFPELSEKDDPAQVEEARAEWNLFRLQVQEVMGFLTKRMETAMLRWRRWRLADFERYLVRHPLRSHLTRALLWGAFETVSKLRVAFRVTEGEKCVDAAGSPVELDPRWPIGVVHPVLLPPDERMIWTDVMSEQGLSLPEWQMFRPVHTLEPGELQRKELSRWTGQPLDYYLMEHESYRLGYHTGAEQRGHRCCRVQYYPALNVTVYLLHTPIPNDVRRYEAEKQPVEVTGIQFRPDDTMTRVPNVDEAVPLCEIDPVLMDEVIGGIGGLVQKARKVDAPKAPN